MRPYYQDESVVLYHGDCREILPRLGSIDAIVTDPPYGLGDRMTGGVSNWPTWVEGTNGRKTGQAWDQQTPEIVPSLPSLANHAIIWGGNYFDLPPARGWLVWDKIVRQFSGGHAELAWTTLDQPVRAFSYAHGQLASEGKFHPTQKPVPLMQWCIRFLPRSDGDIFDPFAGSGTTLRAAKDEGRHAIGVEIEERYCEIAARRLDQGVLDFARDTTAGTT